LSGKANKEEKNVCETLYSQSCL